MTRVNKVRGMNDLIPEQIGNWQVVENQIKKIFQSYGYNEIRFPLIEKTELFSRGVGQSTDIVNKEMYTFEDKGGESMSLRPEGTAGCVRAALDNDLIRVDSPRLWYMGPMFRYERPQKGRSRQFHQASAEFFGIKDPFADAELLFLSKKIWEVLGISDQVELEINSLGDHQTRSSYKEALTNYFRDYQKDLDKDSLRQLDENPLRILDSKNPEIRTLLDDAPKITQFLDPESVDHHSILLELLNSNGLTYRENPQLVRGLDYYNKTVFEWKSSSLGAQDTICGGGRYDSLVEELGGKPCPAIGFSIGLERLVLISEKIDENINSSKVISFIALGEEAISKSVLIAEQLRNELVNVQIVLNFENTSASSQLKKAIKLKSDYALIVGEEELKDNTIALKALNEKEEQKSFKINELIDQLKK
ncbi:MAG: histidine--tRNA ligase [Pseudomonadota bacterium]|nr:histidine--tRNA ligase [Pseudomonadota bacterium]